jgi:hypothetical protein
MTRRVVIGTRGNGDRGIFISPSGVDAFTAADSALILSMSSKISQLLLLGQISSSGTVSLGLGKNPIVILTTQNTFDDGGASGYGTINGPSRPAPCATIIGGSSTGRGSLASATINSSGANMSVTTSVKTFYAVYNGTL